MFKKIVAFTLTFCCWANVQAQELRSFDDIVLAVKKGNRITIVADWDKCDITNRDVKLNLISSFTPKGVVFEKNQKFVFARGMEYTHKIHSIPGLEQLGPVYQAYEGVISEDKGLNVINRFVDPVSYVEKIPAVKLHCQFGGAFRVFAH